MQAMTGYAGPEADAARREARATSERPSSRAWTSVHASVRACEIVVPRLYPTGWLVLGEHLVDQVAVDVG